MIKKEIFDQDLQEVAKFSRVLSHPARLSILQYIAGAKCCISGDISDFLPLSRSTVSQHLTELKSLGLIKGEIDGLKVNYCLDTATISKYRKMFNTLFDEIEGAGLKCNC